jgi:DNA-binding protein YbaB
VSDESSISPAEAARRAAEKAATDLAAAEARATLQRSQDFRSQVSALRFTAERADGAVRVVVDGDGLLVDVGLQPTAKASGNRVLARDIMRLNDEASALAAQRSLFMGRIEFGDDSEIVGDLQRRADETAPKDPEGETPATSA